MVIVGIHIKDVGRSMLLNTDRLLLSDTLQNRTNGCKCSIASFKIYFYKVINWLQYSC